MLSLLQFFSKDILFCKRPIFSISTSTTSPSFRKAGGFMNAATPLGVPVMMTVPFRKVVALLKCRMIWGTLKIRSSVLDSCLISVPLTVVFSLRLCGSVRTSGETITGPIGANLSKPFADPCCIPDRSGICQYREDTSLPAVYPSTKLSAFSTVAFLQSLPMMTHNSA